MSSAAPIFLFDKAVSCIGTDDSNDVTLPVPHAYFKSILTENNKGALNMWSFIIPNEKTENGIESFLVPTKKIEKVAGIELWENLKGKKIEREKSKIRKLWS